MFWTDLRAYDPSFEIGSVSSSELKKDFVLEGIADRKNKRDHSIFFCRSKKFLASVEESLGLQWLVIFEKKFWDGLEQPEKDKLSKELYLWGTVDNVPLAMSFLSRPFYEKMILSQNNEVDGRQMGTCEIDPTAIIAQNVFIGARVTIGKNAYIHSGTVVLSDCSIGEDSVLFPNVTLMANSHVGARCRIHSSTVIGSDGFGYNFKEGIHHKVWHLGGVIIGNDVEIGSGTSIDQGTFSPTVIRDLAKIDNQVHLAHNVEIGRGVIVCGQVGFAGSASAGDYSVFAGQAGVGPEVSVGRQCQVGGSAGVTSHLPDGSIVGGYPARPLKEFLRGVAVLRRLAQKKDK